MVRFDMLEYCEYIANVIRQGLKADKADFRTCVSEVGSVMFELGPDGKIGSTRRTITVWGKDRKQYRVTVEEV
jgi:hypothetical protein